MKACAVMFFLLGIFAFSIGIGGHDTTKEKAVMLTKNFLMYREAVSYYVNEYPEEALAMTTIAEANFADWLPTGYEALRPWIVQMSGDICYIYGSITPIEGIGLFQNLQSASIGISQDGVLTSTGFLLPTFIPDNNFVAIIQVTP